jgi:hypothetical protein
MYPDDTKDPLLESSYSFASSDVVFRSIVDGGFEPYFRIWDSAGHVSGLPTTATGRSNWAKAAVEVVRHYRSGQWNGFTSSQFTYVEIGNEPDSQGFWPSPRTRDEFFSLFAETANALRAAFPDLKIGGPGFTAAVYGTGQLWLTDFLAFVRNDSVPFDFLSWHTYTNDPAELERHASYFRSALDAQGFYPVESHVTEWNSNARETGVDVVALREGATGAAIVTAEWIVLQAQGVDQSMIYRACDPSPVLFPTIYGLYYADGRPTRSMLAFSLWTKFATHSSRVDIQTTGSLTKLTDTTWTLAGEGSNGELAPAREHGDQRRLLHGRARERPLPG